MKEFKGYANPYNEGFQLFNVVQTYWTAENKLSALDAFDASGSVDGRKQFSDAMMAYADILGNHVKVSKIEALTIIPTTFVGEKAHADYIRSIGRVLKELKAI
jgi:hypothetical protein